MKAAKKKTKLFKQVIDCPGCGLQAEKVFTFRTAMSVTRPVKIPNVECPWCHSSAPMTINEYHLTKPHSIGVLMAGGGFLVSVGLSILFTPIYLLAFFAGIGVWATVKEVRGFMAIDKGGLSGKKVTRVPTVPQSDFKINKRPAKPKVCHPDNLKKAEGNLLARDQDKAIKAVEEMLRGASDE